LIQPQHSVNVEVPVYSKKQVLVAVSLLGETFLSNVIGHFGYFTIFVNIRWKRFRSPGLLQIIFRDKSTFKQLWHPSSILLNTAKRKYCQCCRVFMELSTWNYMLGIHLWERSY